MPDDKKQLEAALTLAKEAIQYRKEGTADHAELKRRIADYTRRIAAINNEEQARRIFKNQPGDRPVSP